jgi:hypothetical protein
MWQPVVSMRHIRAESVVENGSFKKLNAIAL